MAAARSAKAKAPTAAEKRAAAARAATVTRIVKLRKKGLGYPAIAKALNDDKVPTFGKGKTWYGPVVRNICIRELGGADESLAAAGTKRPAAAAKK